MEQSSKQIQIEKNSQLIWAKLSFNALSSSLLICTESILV